MIQYDLSKDELTSLFDKHLQMSLEFWIVSFKESSFKKRFCQHSDYLLYKNEINFSQFVPYDQKFTSIVLI